MFRTTAAACSSDFFHSVERVVSVRRVFFFMSKMKQDPLALSPSVCHMYWKPYILHVRLLLLRLIACLLAATTIHHHTTQFDTIYFIDWWLEDDEVDVMK